MSESQGKTSIGEIDKGYAESSEEETEPDNNYLKLRRLLLGEEYSSALNRYITKEEDAERVSEVLPKAVRLSTQTDLGEALSPVVDKAIEQSIEQNPTRITNILFPIIGPAIRKAVASALAEMVQSLNTLLEQSLTLGSLNWRVRAWRAGMPYAQYVLLQTVEYRVEQVLLVHRETGLLLNSVTASEVETQDPELVSSMLTAISDFVSDSFSAGKETLERIRFGDLELHLLVGPHAVLAVAVRGSASDELALKANTTIETVHAQFDHQLVHFEGDRAEFDETTPILSECLLTQKVEQKEKKKPWLALILLLCVAAYLVANSIESWRIQSRYQKAEELISREPGYTVLSSKRENDQLYVKALRSPESRPASTLRDNLLKGEGEGEGEGVGEGKGVAVLIDATVVHMGPLPKPEVKQVEKVSEKPVIDVEAMTNSLLAEGEEVSIIAQGESLSIKGDVSEATRQRLMNSEVLNSYYEEADFSGLTVLETETELEKFKQLVEKVQSTVFYFEPNESRLSEDEVLKVPGVVAAINEMETIAAAERIRDLQIIVMGFADRSGSSFGNNTVSQQRADSIRTILTDNAVSSDIIVAWGVGNIDLDVVSDQAQRRVTLQVLYSDKTRQPNQAQSADTPTGKGDEKDVNPGDSWWVK
ncbi:OmpA family protein [Alkalimarinus coralli]|uniref:OmpA family protein n=1 Tax=Alkalimarinus coralli TaxID=2935863 RepID=UPI00202B78B4|nr:OmpA family protein [Alkalimarinus coralli]